MSAVPCPSLSLNDIRAVIAEAIRPAHFFTGANFRLEWAHQPRETIFWEIFHGRLLDSAQTRQQETFESWHIFTVDADGRSSEPLLSVKLDSAGHLHVTRAILSYTWEGYHAGDNVYLSRETRKWLRELVGSIELDRITGRDELQRALIHRLFQAVVGLSRLPLTSLEAPLPAFTLGQLAYFHRPADVDTEPMRSYQDLIQGALSPEQSPLQQAKLLETVLRSTPADVLPEAAALFVARWQQIGRSLSELPALFRVLFDEVALSPYTDFVDRTLAFLRHLEEQGHLTATDHADFLAGLLRQLGRHLTAYDLVIFHHRGANYPDALLLDAALRAYLSLVQKHPALFRSALPEGRGRRGALRQAWLLHRRYTGHEVPDLPTSPGENARVLPAPHARVPEEQITDPTRRSRQLFADAPLELDEAARDLLRQSVRDLEHPVELRELGTALFLDRPLGAFKRPGEPDQTLLLSYLAFSATIARRRLQFLAEQVPPLLDAAELASLQERVDQGPEMTGVPLQPQAGAARPGLVSLADAFKAAPDFVLLQTTRRGVRDFLARYDLASLAGRVSLDFLTSGKRVLIVTKTAIAPAAPGTLLVLDDRLQTRLEFGFDPRDGYEMTDSGEHPVGGLRLLRSWEPAVDAMRERDWRAEDVLLRPPR